MNQFGIKAENANIADLGLGNVAAAYWNLNVAELVEETIVNASKYIYRSLIYKERNQLRVVPFG